MPTTKGRSPSRRIDELSKPKIAPKSTAAVAKSPSPSADSGATGLSRPTPPPSVTYHIYRNGHPARKAHTVKLFPHDYATMADFCQSLVASGAAQYGCNRLYNTDGEIVRQIGQLQADAYYVAAVNDYIDGDYGKKGAAKSERMQSAL